MIQPVYAEAVCSSRRRSPGTHAQLGCQIVHGVEAANRVLAVPATDLFGHRAEKLSLSGCGLTQLDHDSHRARVVEIRRDLFDSPHPGGVCGSKSVGDELLEGL